MSSRAAWATEKYCFKNETPAGKPHCVLLLFFFFSVKHNWETMTEAIQNHISSLNWGYRLSLREKGVAYINAYGEFVEPHKIKVQCGFAVHRLPSLLLAVALH